MIAWVTAIVSKLPFLGALFEKFSTTSSKAEELKAEVELEEAKTLRKKGWISPKQLAKYCLVILGVVYALVYLLNGVYGFTELPTAKDVLSIMASALSVLGG